MSETETEAELQQKIQIEGPFHSCILMRNNCGAMCDTTGRLVRYGLGNISPKQKSKSSDLIGITMVTITPEMVGQKIGVFTAIEVKNPNWKPDKKLDPHEQAQKNFLDWVRACGGLSSFVNSLDSFRQVFRK